MKRLKEEKRIRKLKIVLKGENGRGSETKRNKHMVNGLKTNRQNLICALWVAGFDLVNSANIPCRKVPECLP